MRKRVLLFIGIPLVLILFIIGGAYYFIRSQLPTVPAKLQTALKEKNIDLAFANSEVATDGLSVRLNDLSLQGDSLPVSLKAKSFQIKLRMSGWPLAKIVFHLDSPVIENNPHTKPAIDAKATTAPAGLGPKIVAFLVPFVNVRAEIQDASYQEKGVRGLSLVLDAGSFALSPEGLSHAEGYHTLKLAKYEPQPVVSGLVWEGKSLYQNQTVEALSHKIELGPFVLSAEGKYSLADQKWAGEAAIPETKLAQLPEGAQTIPWLKSLSGELKAKVSAQGVGSDLATIIVEGNIQAKGVKAGVQHEMAKGDLTADIDAQFARNPGLSFSVISKVDGAGLEVVREKLFVKPVGIPLNVEAKLEGKNGVIQIQALKGQFHTLLASADGTVNTEPFPNGNVSLSIPSTDLTGWEQFFPEYASLKTKGTLALKGTMEGSLQDWRESQIHLELQAKDIRVPILPQWIGNQALSIQGVPHIHSATTIDLAKGAIRNLSTDTQVDMKQTFVKYGETFQKPLGTPLSAKLLIQSTANKAEIKKGNFLLGPFHAALKGRIEDFAAPKANLKIETDRIDLAKALAFSPSALMRGMSGLSGHLQTKATIVGPLTSQTARPQISGQLDVRRVAFNYEVEATKKKIRVNEITGPVFFNNDGIQTKKLKMAFPGTSATTDLSMQSFESPVVSFNLSASKFQIRDFYDPPQGGAPAGVIPVPVSQKAGTKEEPDFRTNPYLRKLKLTGDIVINNADLGSSKAEQITAKIDYDKLFLKLSPVTMRTFGGVITSHTEWDGRSEVPATKQNLKVAGVDANQFITSYSENGKDIITGKLNTDMSLQFSGMKPEAIKRTLTGKGSFLLNDGTFRTIRFTQKPLEALKKVPVLSRGITKTDWDERFHDITGQFHIENGQVKFTNMILRAGVFDLIASEASIDFDANLKGRAIWYPKESLVPASAAAAFLDDQGKPSLPLAFSGPLKSPTVTPDMSVLEPRLKAYASRKVEEEKKRAIAATKEKVSQEAQKTLKKGLGNIFKK